MGTDGDICGHFSKRAFFLLLFAADFKIESWVERQKSAFEAGLEKGWKQDFKTAG